MSDPIDPLSEPRSLPRIELRLGEDQLLVVPPAGFNGRDTVLPFPKMPQSLLDWAILFGELFWQQHRRCVAIVLLLNCQTRRWGVAIPTQRCGRDSVCWTMNPKDFAALPAGASLAGSFQARRIRSPEEIADAVPPVPGVHFVQTIEPRQRGVWMFVNAGGDAHVVGPELLIADEWALLLNRQAARLQIV